jgi:RNase HII (EC 3.1.26.4)
MRKSGRHSLAWSIAESSVEEIDQRNILQATLLAMQRAVAALPCKIDLLLVDGNQTPQVAMPCRAIVGGDAAEPAISAASIIAKVYRDRLMAELAQRYPGYGFERHSGYGTAAHRAALLTLGTLRRTPPQLCPYPPPVGSVYPPSHVEGRRVVKRITSAENPLIKTLRSLSTEPGAVRKLGQVWLEGIHLIEAALAAGHAAEPLITTDTGLLDPEIAALVERVGTTQTVVLHQALFNWITAVENGPPVGMLIARPKSSKPRPGSALILDRVQDAGNVGTMLRTAAASGCGAVYLLRGCAGVWSPKVLRRPWARTSSFRCSKIRPGSRCSTSCRARSMPRTCRLTRCCTNSI